VLVFSKWNVEGARRPVLSSNTATNLILAGISLPFLRFDVTHVGASLMVKTIIISLQLERKFV
jgi:hypothetical protein